MAVKQAQWGSICLNEMKELHNFPEKLRLRRE